MYNNNNIVIAPKPEPIALGSGFLLSVSFVACLFDYAFINKWLIAKTCG
ncbi:hypothetical protein GCM10009129_18500 [Psychrobacter aestuarii]|uniref:Uncharacterized protein n=1 Tax=Psychrobacter aestuarii TaxID=556327 RepID=A0ABN0VZ56_9GAMM